MREISGQDEGIGKHALPLHTTITKIIVTLKKYIYHVELSEN